MGRAQDELFRYLMMKFREAVYWHDLEDRTVFTRPFMEFYQFLFYLSEKSTGIIRIIPVTLLAH